MTTFRQGANQRATDRGIVLYQQQLSHKRTVTGATHEMKESRLK
jgi:hypothetical protein